MTLIKSISGFRGTIGGMPGEGLTPEDIVKFSAAFAAQLQATYNQKRIKVVVGRDARISGKMVSGLAVNTLIAMGIDVVDLGLTTTPTVEMAVPIEKAQGGIIFTASHNPAEWNAMKFLNDRGEFISQSVGKEILERSEQGNFSYASIGEQGSYVQNDSYLEKHLQSICALPLVDAKAIEGSNFTVVCDAVNSSGGIYVPALLKKLGVAQIITLNGEPNGVFAHNPEPLPEHLDQLVASVQENKADLGIVVDPDVDRLAMVCENGDFFGEEYTLVAVADYILKHKKGDVVSNLSSSRALTDVAAKHGVNHHVSAVGEVNVVEKMKEVNAVIGGEGNGGVIYPELHYGRDALVGVALFLSHLARMKEKCSELRAGYPNYHLSKNKIALETGMDLDAILTAIETHYESEKVNNTDGVRIDFEQKWVHLRKSNTEPIIRIYAEAESKLKADDLAKSTMSIVREFAQKAQSQG